MLFVLLCTRQPEGDATEALELSCSLRLLTFALQALSEEAFQQLLAVLADSGSGVRVDQEGVRNFNLRQ